MATYTVQDTTMTALGDAVRKALGVSDTIEEIKGIILNKDNFTITITPKYSTNNRYILNGSVDADNIGNSFYIKGDNDDYLYGNQGHQLKNTEFPIEIETNAEQITIRFFTSYTGITCSFDLTIIPLDENGNEFKYTPAEMIEKIDGLITIPEEALTITGSCENRFSNGQWDWFIETAGDTIITKDITNCSSMFSSTKIKELNFQINGATSSSVSMDSAFEYATNLTNCPKLNIPIVGYMQYIFSQCQSLREIKDDDWNVNTYSGHSNASNRDGYIFGGCYSLRRITEKLLKNVWNLITSSRSAYNSTFSGNYSLDEINKLGVSTATYTSNMFSYTFYQCCRVKDLTFDKNDDGTVKTANWSNQTIDLATYVGYGSYNNYITGYNSGITSDKKVYDDATYQALKDDPDWYSLDINYSRYNHDSAVNTINSLPDCSSSGGTNTIKFMGQSGALTDGGAINTLTEEEIAVASAKGWTVSLV